MDYSLPKLLEILAEGRDLVLATIVEAKGSTPQVAGATAIFSQAGLVAGTVGGGLLEARVEAAARQALADGKARLVAVHLDADPADVEGAICGGEVEVLVDPGVARDRDLFSKALEGFRKPRPGYLVTGIRPIGGGLVITDRVWLPFDEPWHLEKRGLAAEVLDVEGGQSLIATGGLAGPDHLTFLMQVRPLPRLVIAGAGHVGKAVARLGRLLDFSVTVIDDRAEFASAANVPDADTVILGDIGEAVGAVEGSADNYYVIVTRGHRKDAEALRAVIGKRAAYVGMIGSRQKIEIVRREFLAKGWATAEEWARVHAPIGLDIGSKTVDEIAVSIAAELVQVRGRRKPEAPA